MDSVAYHEADRRGGGRDGSEGAREGEWEGGLHVLWWMGFDVYVYLRRGVEEATRKKKACFAILLRTRISFQWVWFEIY